MRAAIFGAGNIGRGLVGQVLADSGYQLTFIDADAAIVQMLQDDPTYGIQSSASYRDISMDGVFNAADEDAVVAAVAAADVIATAVGPAVLRIVAPAIGRGLELSQLDNVNVLACENIHPNSTALRSHIVDACGEAAVSGVGFPNVVVDRIAPGAPGSRTVEVEAGFEFVVDIAAWVGPTPEGPVVFTPNLDAYKLRKLWLVNGLHVVAAWLGLQQGHEHIHEAMGDDRIRDTVQAIGSTVSEVLVTRSSEFAADELRSYCARSLDRFSDGLLPDQTRRVARNPLDKLVAGERVMAPARGADQLGIDTEGFADAVAAALTLRAPDIDGIDRLRAAIDDQGWEKLVVEHCGVQEGGSLYKQIETRMSEQVPQG